MKSSDSLPNMLIASVGILITFLALQVSANGNIVTFQELVCQHCNAIHGQDEAATPRTLAGKAGPPGAPGPRGYPGLPGPRGPPGQVNVTALRELVRYEAKISREGSSLDINETVLKEIIKKEIELALESFRNQSKVDVRTTATTLSDEWTVFQRRRDGSVDFNRVWNDYVNGFGNEAGDFWLGLENIYQLTKSKDKEMQIDMIASDGRYFTALYNLFYVGPSSDNYMIHLSGYSGNATNSFQVRQNNMRFSTKDSDHDTWSTSCAQERKGGWWYSNCYTNLNGIFSRVGKEGIRWYSDDISDYISMRYTEMKIRRSA